jgi:hypothetical protein
VHLHDLAGGQDVVEVPACLGDGVDVGELGVALCHKRDGHAGEQLAA